MSARPRRRKRSAFARLRPFWILLFFVALAAGIGAYYGASWPGFRPSSVTVSGNRIVTTREILARAAISPDENIWLQNMGAAASRVRTIPYIDTAAIHRMPPANVSIVVTERRPVAVLQAANGSFLIDRELRVLMPVAADVPLPRIVLPVAAPATGKTVTDDRAARLLSDANALAQAHVAIAELHLDRFGDVVATMRNGIELLLGDDADIVQKSALIAPILSQTAAGPRRVAAIDLRAPKTPVVRYK